MSFLLLMCTDELLSTTNIIKFLQNPLLSDNVTDERTSNPIPYPE